MASQAPSGRRVRTLTVASGKGGAGKSTTSAAIAAAAAAVAGWKTVLVDLDPQCVSLVSLGAEPVPGQSLAEALVAVCDPHAPQVSAREALVRDVSENLDVLVATDRGALRSASLALSQSGGVAFESVARLLTQIQDDYDLAVLDTPPESGGIQEYALCASDRAIAVSRANGLDWPPARALYEQVSSIAGSRFAPDLRFLGLVINDYEPRAEETGFIESEIAASGVPVFDTRLPHSRLASKGATMGRPAVLAFPWSPFAQSCRALTAEVLGHLVAGTSPAALTSAAEVIVLDEPSGQVVAMGGR